jgi:hypothetical protein
MIAIRMPPIRELFLLRVVCQSQSLCSRDAFLLAQDPDSQIAS